MSEPWREDARRAFLDALSEPESPGAGNAESPALRALTSALDACQDHLRDRVAAMRDRARMLSAAQSAPELMLGFSAQDEVLTAVLRLIGDPDD